MKINVKKVYTCTPVSFLGGVNFFSRDTGLFCKTLLSLGIESKSICLLPHQEGEYTDLIIRASMSELTSAAWWKAHNLDAVLLYSWGMPKYTLIARAIKKAGIRLIIHMDTSGNFNNLLPERSTPIKKVLKTIYAAFKNFFRSIHLGYADVITMAPVTATAISKMAFFDSSIVKKNYPCPNPVSPMCRYQGNKKENTIICVGRWNDDFQKRPRFLMKALDCYYQGGGNAKTLIYGQLTPEMELWHMKLPKEQQKLIELGGFIKNSQLLRQYQSAKILCCPSSYEGSHIASAEALCSGCSIVVTNRPAPLRVVHWYTTKNSGTISKEDTPESFAAAICTELQEWDSGNRDPQQIASSWYPHFHTDKVLEQILR